MLMCAVRHLAAVLDQLLFECLTRRVRVGRSRLTLEIQARDEWTTVTENYRVVTSSVVLLARHGLLIDEKSNDWKYVWQVKNRFFQNCLLLFSGSMCTGHNGLLVV